MIVRTGICYVFREGGRTGSEKAGCRAGIGVRYKRERVRPRTTNKFLVMGTKVKPCILYTSDDAEE